jgi:hypothetical protein
VSQNVNRCSLLRAFREVLQEAGARAVARTVGITFFQADVGLQATEGLVVLCGAICFAVLDPIAELSSLLVMQWKSVVEKNSLLHIVVALEEVSNLPLAQFGVTQLPSGRRAAQNELSPLFRAGSGSLVGVYELLETTS